MAVAKITKIITESDSYEFENIEFDYVDGFIKTKAKNFILKSEFEIQYKINTDFFVKEHTFKTNIPILNIKPVADTSEHMRSCYKIQASGEECGLNEELRYICSEIKKINHKKHKIKKVKNVLRYVLFNLVELCLILGLLLLMSETPIKTRFLVFGAIVGIWISLYNRITNKFVVNKNKTEEFKNENIDRVNKQ